MASRHLKPTMSQCSLSPGRILSGHNFQNFAFGGAQNFSKWAWAMGPRLPRQNTAAFGSCDRPSFSRWAACRGQGGCGCGGQRRPWPRTKGFRWENVLRQWDLYVRKWMKCWFDSRFFCSWFLFNFVRKVSVKTCAPVVTIFHDCVLCPPWLTLFCGPTLGSDFAPEFGECPPLYCDFCFSAGLITSM